MGIFRKQKKNNGLDVYVYYPSKHEKHTIQIIRMYDKDGRYFEKKIHHYPNNGGQKCWSTSRHVYKEK